MLYDELLKSMGKAIKDPTYRNKMLKDPNGTLKADGVETGNAKVKLDWVESTNCLNIQVTNGGADWSGAILFKLEK